MRGSMNRQDLGWRDRKRAMLRVMLFAAAPMMIASANADSPVATSQMLLPPLPLTGHTAAGTPGQQINLGHQFRLDGVANQISEAFFNLERIRNAPYERSEARRSWSAAACCWASFWRPSRSLKHELDFDSFKGEDDASLLGAFN